MRTRGRLVSLALALAIASSAGGVNANTGLPRIGKPRPAPDTPSTMPALPPAHIDNSLDIGGDDIDAKKVESRMTVKVHVNGRGPYDFVVDSGADTSVVGLRVANDLQLPLGTPVILNSMTARNIVDRVRVDSLALGPSVIRDLHLPALRESHLGGDGMIGIDALVRQRLLMDFEDRSIKVEDARKPYKSYPGEIVVTARRQKGQLILTEVRANRLSLDAVIDTGSMITIGNMALRDKLLKSNRHKVWTVQTTGVTGKTVELQLAKLPELRLGSVVLRDVPIAFADVPPFRVFGINDGPALLLGTDILELFRRISLDFRARKVRFQIKRCGSATFGMGTSPTGALSRLTTTGTEICAS